MQKILFSCFTPVGVPESLRFHASWSCILFSLFIVLYVSVYVKGVLHTTGGYMVYTATTFKYAFDYKPTDIYW